MKRSNWGKRVSSSPLTPFQGLNFELIVSNSNPFSRSTRFGVENVADIPFAPNRFASLGVIHIESLRLSFVRRKLQSCSKKHITFCPVRHSRTVKG
ncbi:MAG: hypothetical protein LBG15_05450 [Dysgonamonadaceae bacterium]|jgi:hypothetical protein|nr:hypothetical protein [Dysgonamonadaceae bacterium]